MKEWEKCVRQVVPYTPGEQPVQTGVVKLNTNENPYPPAPGVLARLRDIDGDALRKYPDPTADVLVTQLAETYGLKKDQVFVGVGSDDVLAMIFMTFFNSEKPIFFPDITYSFYDVWADLFRTPYQLKALDQKFRIVKEDYYGDNGGVIFPNPNAPTGILQPLQEVEEIIRHNREVIVVVDEAYIDFGGESAVSLLDKYDNLLVVQTFSKSRSMAGMRVGYVFGDKKLISYLNDVKYSFNSYTMNAPVLQAAAAGLKDEAYFAATTGKIVATRERVKQELADLGFKFEDSQANFLFVTHPQMPARELFEALKIQKIYVRYFNKPRIDNYLRITIGTDEEMDKLIDFLKQYREKQGE